MLIHPYTGPISSSLPSQKREERPNLRWLLLHNISNMKAFQLDNVMDNNYSA